MDLQVKQIELLIEEERQLILDQGLVLMIINYLIKLQKNIFLQKEIEVLILVLKII